LFSRFRHILQIGLYRLLVEFIGLPLDDVKRSLGALTDTGAKPVAQPILHDAGLAVNYPERPFGASRNTLPAAVALLFVYFKYFSYGFHGFSFIRGLG
jgi:hypothetical protein